MARRRRNYRDAFRNERGWGASQPIKTKGGIKAQSKRGAFGKSWWAKAWIEVLESFDIGGRLSRGKTYARKGQVTDIHIAKGLVEAKVQGSFPTPYEVTLRVAQLDAADWEKVGKALTARVSFAARLLVGEMPDHIGDVFEDAGLSLFPEKEDDLQTDCDCPDWSNPCKHIAAVYYLLGEAFDGDPFLIFELRGLERSEIADLIGELPQDEIQEPILPPEPLPTDPQEFWSALEKQPDLEAQNPTMDAAFVKRLGGFPFWRGEQPFLETMETCYANASQEGQRLLRGESPSV